MYIFFKQICILKLLNEETENSMPDESNVVILVTVIESIPNKQCVIAIENI